LKHLKRLSPQLWSLSIGFRILELQLRLIETDASNYALVTVLSIMTPNGEFHPIAFHSLTFWALELDYNVHDKELFAIFEAFK